MSQKVMIVVRVRAQLGINGEGSFFSLKFFQYPEILIRFVVNVVSHNVQTKIMN